MADTPTHEITSFRGDMTTRWPCRGGDFILWFGYRDIFSGPEAVQCYDLWEMRDGYYVTITNCLEDLPPWFRLHPTEVCGRLVYKMMAKVEKGDYPSEPLNGPNLWRAAWPRRSEHHAIDLQPRHAGGHARRGESLERCNGGRDSGSPKKFCTGRGVSGCLQDGHGWRSFC